MSNRVHFKESIKRQVRQDCRFGCVICGCPVYHYDHIVEYKDTLEHDPENLVLLCGLHHDLKTRGHLTARAVRRAKNKVLQAGVRPRAGSVPLSFENAVELHLGSNVVVAQVSPRRRDVIAICIDDVVVLGLRFEEGRPVLNAAISDVNNKAILRIIDSELQVGEHLWDITYVGNLLTMKIAEHETVLQIRFAPESNVVEVVRGLIYAEGVGLRIADGVVTLLNTGHAYHHNLGVGQGFRFGVQKDKRLQRALYSFTLGLEDIPRFDYEPAQEGVVETMESSEVGAVHEDVNVVLSDLVEIESDGVARIAGHTFIRCRLIGPLVIVPVRDCLFNGNYLNEAQLWTLEAGRPYLGAVLLEDCRVEACDFEHVGIGGSEQMVKQFKDSIIMM